MFRTRANLHEQVVFRIHEIFGVDPDPNPRIHAFD
jgi:hypothetical protein